jgi:hypothetical protein
MATSGTYTFNPSLGELTVYAYQLIGVRPTAILQEHIDAARLATNMLLANWSNNGTNLWQVDLVTIPLIQGQDTYSIPSNTVVMLDAYIEYGNPPIDRIILPISRTEYASYPNKSQQGFPTVYWMDRLLSPTVTVWPVPDGNETSLKYYRLIQIQDANMNGTEQVDIPQIWLEAFAFALAFRLALIWSPDKAQSMKAMADQTYESAARTGIETAQQYISPQLSGYWR